MKLLSIGLFCDLSLGRGHAVGTPDLKAIVEGRKVSFARTRAKRDSPAFLTFISSLAVFFTGGEPLRGYEAISRVRERLFPGGKGPLRFQWHLHRGHRFRLPLGNKLYGAADQLRTIDITPSLLSGQRSKICVQQSPEITRSQLDLQTSPAGADKDGLKVYRTIIN